MNYGYFTPDFSEADIPLDDGIDYEGDLTSNLEEFRSNSVISTRSLCSALGSHMEIRAKSQHLYDATISPPQDYEVPLHQLRGLRGMYRTENLPQAKDVKTKNLINYLLKKESSVYRSRKDRPLLSASVRNTQRSQNSPLHFPIRREQTLPAIHLNSGLKKSVTPKKFQIPRIELHSPDPTEAHAFSSRLLRRPAVRPTSPINDSDPLFFKFTQTIDLKPKVFKTPQEQEAYYEDKYPLLLHANPSDAKTPRKPKEPKRAEVIEDPALERRLTVISRLDHLQEAVDGLEKETDDCEFLTELRDPVFDPTTFPWNRPEHRTDEVPGTPAVTPFSSHSSSEGSSHSSSPRDR
ncbi:uncharacterized protein LOC134244303 [Saccostrea cucullata]|uniref:uncharacterized protein LOC134244303 n=1 Tax=Saccostrea cuccullata TaxID=36930 RepID=UPI002ED516EE